MKTIFALAVCASFLPACWHAADAVAAAAVNSAVGVSAAAVSRASGGCYASCPVGTTCNPKTGLCDELPCRGQCAMNERCDTSGLFARCVRDVPELKIEGVGNAPARDASKLGDP